jgi:hypothetical protein
MNSNKADEQRSTVRSTLSHVGLCATIVEETHAYIKCGRFIFYVFKELYPV